MAAAHRDWAARPLLQGRAAAVTRSTCHGLHMAIVVFGLLGWLVPDSNWLLAHLLFIPSLLVIWRLNHCTCPLNNLETWLTSGRWRNPANPDEGGFLRGLLSRYLGLQLSEGTMDRLIYSVLVLSWSLSLAHFSWQEALI